MMHGISRHQEMLVVLVLLSIVVIGFNYPDIFSAKTMYQDDNHRYILGLENKIYKLIFMRNTLRSIVIFPLYKLLTIDLVYARLAQTLFFYIPLALSWYFLLRFYSKLPAWLIFYSSAVPCVLPGQTQIPLFIDGSYTVQGLLVFILSLHAYYFFLRSNNFSWKLLILSSGLYAASLEMMDHAVFLAPFAILSFIGIASWRKERRKILWISSIIIVLALAKMFQILYFPTVPTSRPISPSVSILISRISMLATSTFPFAFSLSGKPFDSNVLWCILISLLILSFVKREKHNNVIILYGLLWVICSSIVFLTISRFYVPRLSHISGFGINIILAVSVYSFVNKYKILYRNDFAIILFTLILLLSGFSRINIMNSNIDQSNRFHEVFVDKIEKLSFPFSSQLVVLDGDLSIDGWWDYSSGYMKYATNRKDITGLIGPEFKNYDPFNQDMRGFKKSDKMNGLSLTNPIFIFKIQNYRNYELEQKEFALRYINGRWKVYKLNKINGSMQEVGQGDGLGSLSAFLKNSGIESDDVAFSQGREH